MSDAEVLIWRNETTGQWHASLGGLKIARTYPSKEEMEDYLKMLVILKEAIPSKD